MSRGFVSLDVLGSDEELEAAAAREKGREQSSAERVEAEGRDASRAVTVRVDARGRVADVLINNWWRDDLTPAGLQDALLSAYQDGLAKATAELAPHSSAGATPTDVPVEPEGDDGDDYSWYLNVRRSLDRTEESLAQSGERLTQTPGAGRVISGPAGLVRLVLIGIVVSEVQIDARAALQESPNRLAADALAAFQTID